MISISIPFPPSTNSLYRNGGRSRVKTKAYNAWIHAAGNEILTQRAKIMPVQGPYTLVVLLPKSKRRWNMDCSNFIKAPEDLLVRHGLIDDDRHAEGTSSRWAPIEQCEVHVWPFDAERAAIAALPPEGARGQGEAAW